MTHVGFGGADKQGLSLGFTEHTDDAVHFLRVPHLHTEDTRNSEASNENVQFFYVSVLLVWELDNGSDTDLCPRAVGFHVLHLVWSDVGLLVERTDQPLLHVT